VSRRTRTAPRPLLREHEGNPSSVCLPCRSAQRSHEPKCQVASSKSKFRRTSFCLSVTANVEEYNRHRRASPCHLSHVFCTLLSGFGDDHSIQVLILLQNDAQVLRRFDFSDVESSRTKFTTEVNYPRSHSVFFQTGSRVSCERQSAVDISSQSCLLSRPAARAH
jgi:hypothetical protein